MKNTKLLPVALVMLACSVVSIAQTTTQAGIDLYRSGDFTRAAEVLNAVTSVNENDRTAWRYLGASLVKLGQEKDALKAFKNGSGKVGEQIPGDDTPVRIVNRPRAGYTDTARQNNVQGKVVLAVGFESNGEIGFVIAIQELADGLTQQCVAAARRIEFEPATRNGKPVATVGFLEYSFSIY